MLSPEQLEIHKTEMASQGYTILHSVFSADMARELRAEVERLEQSLGITAGPNIFEGFKTLRVYNLLVHGKLFETIPVQEDVLSVVENVLDRGCLVSSLSSINIGPGETEQPLHADDQLIPLPKPHPSIICNTMWAITDFTAANGATRLVPGSHRADRSPAPFGEPVETVAAEMQMGSVLVFDGSIWHAGGANQTDQRRIGIAMNYCSGWMRQQENQQLGIPLEIAKGFSPRLRKLVGFGLYKNLIGHIDKCSPVDLLDGVGKRPVVGIVR